MEDSEEKLNLGILNWVLKDWMKLILSHSKNHFLDQIQRHSKSVGNGNLVVQTILVNQSSIHFHLGVMKEDFVKTTEGKIVLGKGN